MVSIPAARGPKAKRPEERSDLLVVRTLFGTGLDPACVGRSGRQVNVSRRGLWAAAIPTNALVGSNLALNLFFNLVPLGLPGRSAA